MEGYYTLSYKSSPEKVSYVLHRKENKLELLSSSLSPKKIGIGLNEEGIISAPNYFLPIKEVDKKFAYEIISKNNLDKIEKIVGSL